MCTSFAVYSGKKTFIGMNYDNKNPVKIILQEDSQFLILVNMNGQFFPSFGVNKNGTFINTLMVDPNEEGKYRRGKNVVHTSRFLEDVLDETVSLDLLPQYLDEKEIVNVPNHSVHCMVAGKNRNACIVEPGRKNIHIDTQKREFMVLTCFPISDFIGVDYTKVTGPGDDRYKKTYEKILQNQESFNIDVGFSILKETMQYAGDYPTQFSMLSIPEDNVIYFFINGNIEKSFEFSFIDNQIKSRSGFSAERSCVLTKKGILLSELSDW